MGMSIWIASYILLWLIAIFLTAALISLYRHVGLIHMRFGPRGALALAGEGPDLGDRIPETVVTDVNGVHHSLNDGSSRHMLIYVSATCDTCKMLIPAIKTLVRTSSTQVLILCLDATEAYEMALPAIPVVAAESLAQVHLIKNTPYAIAVDEHGLVAAKGIVNTLEHLEDIERKLDRRSRRTDPEATGARS